MRCLADFGMGDKPILPLDHHLCHAATAYYHRPWSEPATVLTLDGAGDGICATVGSGEGHELRPSTRDAEIPQPGRVDCTPPSPPTSA